ncbi:MAG: C39 family peptidase [Syntrophobacterales bacterium]|jgi:ABC-type bacteriocin/lantibiotic exporter with double-glycine peptidase domain
MNHSGRPERTFHAIVTFTMGAALFIVYVSLLSSCSTGAKELEIARPSQAALIKDVPFFPQLDYQCGPASLAGVLNYYGDTVTPGEIAEAIYRQKIRGTVSLDMVLYARQRGFDSKWYEGSTDDIVRAVDSGSPLVVMIDLGFSLARAYHYMVITGYSSQGVIANSGTTPQKLISWERFMSQWERTHNWTLLVTPKKAVLSSRQN